MRWCQATQQIMEICYITSISNAQEFDQNLSLPFIFEKCYIHNIFTINHKWHMLLLVGQKVISVVSLN